MKIRIEKVGFKAKHHIIISDSKTDLLQHNLLETNEKKYLSNCLDQSQNQVFLNRFDSSITLVFLETSNKDNTYLFLNKSRNAGSKLCSFCNAEKMDEISIEAICDTEITLAFIEGLYLNNYQFLKYKSDPKANTLTNCVWIKGDSQKAKTLSHLAASVCYARDLVNEPLSFLTAEQLSTEIKKSSDNSGFSLEVWGKERIQKEKMGGLLAVNKGAPNHPTFNILEWKPANATNSKPYIFVGKGVVYDTGGLSLKPTANSMDIMKSDMGGAATVAGLMEAIANEKLPIHVIGLIPATENRPGLDAYAPGDVITMHDGTTVEVLNTDAEGRMILADALSYAKSLNPESVINLATLTGAAAYAIGSFGIVSMGDFEEKEEALLKDCGNKTHERLAPFPFWEDYDELIKSDIADIKNLGGPVGGAITAGKFLKHFTNYPFMHLDIAGSAYIQKPEPYKPLGGTGVGVRLLFEYLTRKSNV
ncbi:MAG: leucyl aminopeptidase [Flavobacteriales bacterium]|jgi:leucyl aminopeptidase